MLEAARGAIAIGLKANNDMATVACTASSELAADWTMTCKTCTAMWLVAVRRKDKQRQRIHLWFLAYQKRSQSARRSVKFGSLESRALRIGRVGRAVNLASQPFSMLLGPGDYK
jgi:hypothetical protein